VTALAKFEPVRTSDKQLKQWTKSTRKINKKGLTVTHGGSTVPPQETAQPIYAGAAHIQPMQWGSERVEDEA
jgi:fructose/tagatose bisphosphate aldolase